MYWVCKRIMKKNKKIFLLTFFFVSVIFYFPNEVKSQNITSPYSILGIGDVDTKDFGRYFATGNASIARRDASSYNFSNPASLTALPFKRMNFDIAMRGRSGSFSYPGTDTFTSTTKDFVIKRISLAFKVSQKTALAIGLRPYSSINYKYQADANITDGVGLYSKSVDGAGGINQVYFSAAKSIGKKFSVGATASYLFGSLNRETEYFGSSLDLAIKKKEIDFYTGAHFQGGLQYYSSEGKKWQHKVGLNMSVATQLKGQLTTEYLERDSVFNKKVDNDRYFKLPITIGVGYTATLNNKLSFSADANYYSWPYQQVNYSRSYTNPAIRISAGMEYSKKVKTFDGQSEKFYLGWGGSIENSYVRIKNNYLWDYSFSFGGGFHLLRGTSVYGGIEIGNKGNKSNDQIKEKYTQFIIGLTLKDIWIGPKYSRRYQ
jgi:hypothetical protein